MRIRSVVALALATLLVPVTGTVLAVGSGGRVELEDVMRRSDTRSSGTPVTSEHLGNGVLMVWVVGASGPATAVIHPCSEAAPSDEWTFRLATTGDVQYARFTTAVDVCLTSSDPVHVIVDRAGTVSATPDADGSQYVPLPSPVTLWNAATDADEQVIEIAHPAELSGDATAAVVSIEVLTADGYGYLVSHSCASARPDTADVAYRAQRAANVAYVELAPGDELCVYVHTRAHVRVKLLGELATDGPNPALLPPSWRYVPAEVPAPSLRSIVPVRVLDTRKAIGRAGTSKVEADEVVEIDFGDLVGPYTTAVVLNVTVVEPESAGFVTAWPCGGDRPEASNLNFVPGETVPNLVVAKLAPGGTVCLSGISRTHLIADLNGTFETDGGLLAQPVTPERVLDTRKAIGVPTTTRVPAGETLELQLGGSVVPDTAGAVTVNVTVADPQAAGHVIGYPCDAEPPTTSNLNYVAGQTVANLVTAKLSPDGRLCLFTLAETHLIADIGAWYGVDRAAGYVELAPERFLDTRKAIGVPTTSAIPGGRFVRLQVGGVGDVPANAEAVLINLTAAGPAAAGHLTAWPCDASMPTVSNVNYGPGETNPNLATVKLSATGKICIYTHAASHIVGDVAGYLTDDTVDGQLLTLG